MGIRQAKISIIIPIYNREVFLNHTLYSVVNQTFKNIEIICVDDCSTDNSGEIIERFAASDSRIRHIRHDRNLGAGIARKTGILASSGEYIMFLDGDDFLALEACEEMYCAANNVQTDIVQYGTNIISCGVTDQETLNNMEKYLIPYDGVLIGKQNGDIVNFCFAEEKFGFTLSNKIYRGDIVRYAAQYYVEDRFDLAEDLYLFFIIAFFSNSYASVNKKFLNYQYGVGITGDKPWTDKKFESLARVGKIIEYLEDFLHEYEAAGLCRCSLEKIRKTHLAAAIYRWLYNNKGLNRLCTMKSLLRYYKSEDVLAELLQWYYNASEAVQEDIIGYCKELPLFQARDKKIRTIGTFYFRIHNGGIERVIPLLAEIWRRQGYEVVLFTDELPTADDYLLPEGVRRVVLPKLRQKESGQIRNRIRFWHEMLKQYNIDCVVYHAWLADNAVTDLLSIKSAEIPVVMHTHGMFSGGVSSPHSNWAYYTIFISKLFNLADAVVTLTNTDYNWWSMFHKRVYKTINPIQYDLEKIQTNIPAQKNLIYIGRISPEKQIEDMLEILKIVLDNGYTSELHLVGACELESYRSQLQERMEKLQISQYVKMHGFHDDVLPFYKAGGIALITSKAEGYCLTLVESMAFGMPVVLYDLPNLDLVQKRKGLVAVPQGDIAGAGNAICDLLAHEERFSKMSIEAGDSIREMYEVDLGQCWSKIFGDLEKPENFNEAVPDYNQIKNAVHIMVDAYLEGVICREREKQAALVYERQKALQEVCYQPPEDSVAVVVKRCDEGELGFRYIIRFALGWLRYKLFRRKGKDNLKRS